MSSSPSPLLDTSDNVTINKETTIPSLNEPIPTDKYNVRLLLMNGNKTDLICSPTETFGEVKQRILDNWPKEWASDMPKSALHIRLMHYGKFFENEVLLGSTKFVLGETTIVHLVVSGNAALEKAKKEDGGKSSSCCIII